MRSRGRVIVTSMSVSLCTFLKFSRLTENVFKLCFTYYQGESIHFELVLPYLNPSLYKSPKIKRKHLRKVRVVSTVRRLIDQICIIFPQYSWLPDVFRLKGSVRCLSSSVCS